MKNNIMTNLLLTTALAMGFNTSNTPIRRENKINRNWKEDQSKEDKINRIEKAILKRKRNLWHGQPVLCWNNSEAHSKTMRFYNAKLAYVFSSSGTKNEQFQYDNYQAIELKNYNEWNIAGRKTLDLRVQDV